MNHRVSGSEFHGLAGKLGRSLLGLLMHQLAARRSAKRWMVCGVAHITGTWQSFDKLQGAESMSLPIQEGSLGFCTW